VANQVANGKPFVGQTFYPEAHEGQSVAFPMGADQLAFLIRNSIIVKGQRSCFVRPCCISYVLWHRLQPVWFGYDGIALWHNQPPQAEACATPPEGV